MKISQLFSATEWRTKIAHGETVGFNSEMDKAPDGAKEMVRGLIFCRPIRGLVRLVFLPTVSPWATFLRAFGALAAMILFFAVGARAEKTNDLSDAEVQGRNLARHVLEQRPTENFTNTGILQIRDAKGKMVNVPVRFETVVTETNWLNVYDAFKGTNKSDLDIYEKVKNTKISDPILGLAVEHFGAYSNTYLASFLTMDCSSDHGEMDCSIGTHKIPIPADAKIMVPFASSDFWFADLGLEFFHWPEQKILPKTAKTPKLKSTREYTLLESTNPNPSTNGYSRVVSWIDKESGGILEADAYDTKGKLLKVFTPNSFKKVNGQYQISEMQMDNVQTKSRTRLTFDLKN